MAALSFSTAQAQTYTATFSTQPTIDKYGYAADWPWNSTVTVNLGGVDYLITDAINGSFTWNGSAIYYETAGDVNLHIKRKDGQAFKFYGVSLKYTNYQSPPYYVYPFLTLQYATTGSTQADELYDANKTLTVSKPAGVAVTGSGVTLKFSGLATLTLDDLIVGPAVATVAPTVTTDAATSIMTTNAVLGGNVTANGGDAVIARGVVYSTSNTTPTVNGSSVTTSTNGSGSGTFSQTISGLSPSTTYYVRAYATNGVGTSYGAVQLFTTAASLSVGAVTPNPVCAGSTANVTYTSSAVGNPISVYLNGPGTTNLLVGTLGSSNTSGTISVAIPADRVSGTYTVSISGSGVTSTGSTFSVNARPAQPTTTNVSYCQNASATQLTASGQNLKWYTTSSGGTGFTSITPSTVTAGSTTYYVSQAVNGCESDRAPLTVTINTTPLAPSVANTLVVYCQNTTAAALQATATVGNTLNWYNSQGSALGSTAPTPQTTNPGTTFYQVSQRSASGCEGPRVQITVTINAAPAAPATSPVNVCQGSAPVSLVNGVTATGTLKWYTSPTSASLAAAPQVSTSQTGSQVFYVSQTNANGCESSRAAITYTVNALPNPPSVVSPVTYCQNAVAQPLQATPSPGGTLNFYTVASGGIPSISLIPSTSSSNVYYVSQTVNGCESSTRATITVTINATPPRPAVTTPVTYCQFAMAAPLSATASASNTLNWYGTNATGGSATTAAPTPPTTEAVTTVYYVSQQDPLGCEGQRASISVSVTPKPVAPITRAQTVCLNSTPILISAGVTGSGPLTWYTLPTGGAGSTTPPELTTSVPSSTTYYVSQTIDGCESDRASIVYTVNPLPSPPVPTPRTVFYCQGTSATPLTATGQNLNWYVTASGGTATANITPSTTTAGSITYYVSQTDANGCESNRESVTVTTRERPLAPAVSSPVPYCQNAVASPLTAVVMANATLNWYGTNATGGTASTQAPIPPTTTLGSTTYYVSQTDGTGCEGPRAGITVLVNPVPAPPITTPVAVCQNTTPISLANGVTASSSLRWYTTPFGGSGSAVAPVPPTSTVGQTTYYVSQLTSTGCESPRAALTVTINALPLATLRNDGPLSCVQPTVTLTAGGGGTYRFSQGTTQSSSGNTATVSLGGVYSVTVTDGNGCAATAETTVGSDQTSPQASLSNDGPLTCAKTTVTLTAGGTGTYRFSAPASQLGGGNTASVTTGGVYSVTVTSANGCSATAQTTVDVNTTVVAPALTASALSTENTPISVTASGCSGTINWTATGGTGTANGSVYTFSQPGNYGLTATCTVGTCISPSAPSLTLQIRPGGFAISGVELVRCQLLDAGRGQYEISLTPQYSGLDGSPVSFGVTNELAATTVPGPYTLRLYTDNATITLAATQANAQATYRYNWLAACNSTQPAPNRPPVAQPIPNQVLVVGQAYQLELTTYFSDPDGQVLTFTATGLPTGLQLSGSRISGSPAQAGSSTVQVTALDPAGAQVVGSVVLQINPAPVTPTPGMFSIAGVTGVRCETLSVGERQLSFSPVYTGLTGTPVSFGITNELAMTTAPGPYSLKLYTDNPVITLQATQGGTQASYRFEWLAACPTNPTTPPAGNRPPVVGTGLANQTAQVGQGFTLFIAAGTFTDPDNDPLQLSVSGLPAGLSFSSAQNAITGTPAQAGSSTVQVTATDPGGLSVSTSFVLTVQPASTTPIPGTFSIAGVTGVRCETLSVGQRQLSFSPVYTGLTGAPVSFGITNELAMTTAPGPYSLKLYTDNPVITLTATQGGSQASYRFEWLAACATSPNGRQAVAEAGSRLSVVVLGNPVVGESVEVAIRGVEGQSVELSLTDLAGNRLHQQQLPQISADERVVVPVPARQAITILKVSATNQHQEVKLIRQ